MPEKKRLGKADATRQIADARELYLLGQFEQKRICEIVGISQNTLTKWKAEGRWEDIANARRAGKARFTDILLEQILALDDQLKAEGRKALTSKEVNQMWQLHNMLEKVETAGSATQTVEVLKQFTEWLRLRKPAEVSAIADLVDEYITDLAAKEKRKKGK